MKVRQRQTHTCVMSLLIVSLVPIESLVPIVSLVVRSLLSTSAITCACKTNKTKWCSKYYTPLDMWTRQCTNLWKEEEKTRKCASMYVCTLEKYALVHRNIQVCACAHESKYAVHNKWRHICALTPASSMGRLVCRGLRGGSAHIMAHCEPNKQ